MLIVVIVIIMDEKTTKQYKLLFFGYPSDLIDYTGGFLWMKKVADYIEKSGLYLVEKIRINQSTKITPYNIINNIRIIIKGLTRRPDIAILDAWGESNIILWLLFRVFKPRTKILIVFHHHEPRIPICRNILEVFYNNLIQKFTATMLKDSDIILTVSQASKYELVSVYGIGVSYIDNSGNGLNLENKNYKKNEKRIVIVGTGVDDTVFQMLHDKDNINHKKEIDFLCIGRIEKFNGLEKIWSKIKSVRPNSKLVMAGRATAETINRLSTIGIEHKGFISEEEKSKLYLKSKVFLFPSTREGFGIAVAEALYSDLPVIAWKLPVFEELYSKTYCHTKLKLIELGEDGLFADECINALNRCDRKINKKENKKISFIMPNWKTVGEKVITTIDSLKY